jgi:signal transduction histidine kinase
MSTTPADRDSLIEAVRRVPLMASLSDDAVVHYVARGTSRHVPAGGYIAEQGDAQSWFQLLLAGRVEWTRRLNGSDVHVLTHHGGDYFGHEPILLDIPVPVTGHAVEPCWVLRFEADTFWELLASCPEVRVALVSTVTQRSGTLEAVTQQQAKLAALGTMAAGLAHELNNPAAAVRSGAAALGRALDDLTEQAPPAAAAVYRAAAARADAGDVVALSGLAAADREDELGELLDGADVPEPWEAAAVLMQAGVTPDDVRALTDAGPPTAVRWLVAQLRTHGALAEIRDGAARIGDLVAAMRDYTYLDQGPLQNVDIARSLESTLTILGHKLRRRDVEVVRDYAPDLPTVAAHGSELNQVWTNLIANALDAIGESGRLTLRTRRDGDLASVVVADDGPGIPPEIIERVFEPYFTTKSVGSGTGLGLDVSHRIVTNLGGDLRVTSRPGETVFTVWLPLNRPGAASPTTD